jgi:hypothetical protein
MNVAVATPERPWIGEPEIAFLIGLLGVVWVIGVSGGC